MTKTKGILLKICQESWIAKRAKDFRKIRHCSSDINVSTDKKEKRPKFDTHTNPINFDRGHFTNYFLETLLPSKQKSLQTLSSFHVKIVDLLLKRRKLVERILSRQEEKKRNWKREKCCCAFLFLLSCKARSSPTTISPAAALSF